MSREILFFDTEVNPRSGRVEDYGAEKDSGEMLHTSSERDFAAFIHGAGWLAGHNVVDFDRQYMGVIALQECPQAQYIDTLWLSPLLFPARPYHHLVKDGHLQSGELNNPLNDARKARELFEDERKAFLALPEAVQGIYAGLLGTDPHFSGFFSWLENWGPEAVAERIRYMRRLEADGKARETGRSLQVLLMGRICAAANLESLAADRPVELAYAAALIRTEDRYAMTPAWVTRRFPRLEAVMRTLRGVPCGREDCLYCRRKLDVRRRLKEIFGFDSFRTYGGVPLQERAARAAVEGKSLLAVFPTGGGKSLTFQLPALMAGEISRGLTVVISPLQSLMKDQVDHLEERGIADAVTLNGLQDPLERKAAVDRVESGLASILYVAPESLRSRTVEHLLMNRHVARFVIDEAHCFSAWGQDFRVDYLYIGDFIRRLGEEKRQDRPIPVSCFTATAKQKVISDIRDYFRRKLGLELELFTTPAERENLHYQVLYLEDDERKYAEMRRLILGRDCPVIVYVSRVRRTRELASRLRRDGISAEPYNGRMDSTEKVRIQNDFLQNRIRVIVATSAFGMGVDKPDVGLVIHFDIADSLENYAQEAGRAGRDPRLEADCYVLFNEGDLDKHFVLLNQTRLTFSEIQQVWMAVKALSRNRENASFSALEIARQAGWDENVTDPETRVTGAVAALEDAGYLERGRNVPHIYASSIQASNMAEAGARLEAAKSLSDQDRETARRVLGYLISRKMIRRGKDDTAESRVDYLADKLGLRKETVIRSIQQMREEGLLADQTDLSAFLRRTDTENRAENILRGFVRLESFLIDELPAGEPFNYKELNDRALRSGVDGATVKKIKTLVLYWTVSGELRKTFNADDERVVLQRTGDPEDQRRRFNRRAELCRFIVHYLFRKSGPPANRDGENAAVLFSVTELEQAFARRQELVRWVADSEAIQQALLYLARIQALTLDGGFLVSYNAMQIRRREMDNRRQYRKESYRQLAAFYEQRREQIHIVGEYAHLMVKNYEEALQFVRDYFHMDYRGFLEHYFQGERREDILRNMTPERYDRLFGALSPIQTEIIRDETSRVIAVLAGPGSGKTRVLVHKLAALVTLDDVKHDQLLMLTFSRAAATEFKRRLLGLIGGAAHWVEIKTFHSYCFDLLGKIGNLEETDNVVAEAVRMIRAGEVESRQITKTVLVIDEAQDMDAREADLVRALMEHNEGMRVIAVGDDDQNIYAFRGSDARYLAAFSRMEGARTCEMTANYRSDRSIVALSNAFAGTMRGRLKTRPGEAVSDTAGETVLQRYPRDGTLVPSAAREIARRTPSAGEKCCVLTATNEDAARLTGMLKSQGVRARLMQSSEGFDLYNLAEIRHFMRALGGGDEERISEEGWRRAREQTARNYAGSTALGVCLRMLDTFASVNRMRFRSDLEEYLHESKLEDFADTEGDAVLVGTMHGAKGREFDRVDVVLRPGDTDSDEKKRAVYVAITRARHRLTIHTDSSFFDPFAPMMTDAVRVSAETAETERLLIPLTHRDVDLGWFRGREERTLALRAGQTLEREGKMLLAEDGRAAARLSRAFQEKLDRLEGQGYAVKSVRIRFVLAWKGRDGDKETAILLPEMELERG